jgi:ADP-ribose pyrophosphatase
MIQPWTVLQEQDVSPSRWMPIVRHTVKLANDNIVDDYYFSKLGNVALVLAVTTQNEIVLVRQYKHGVGAVVLELPGGMQDDHLTMEACALAELHEETGIKADATQLISLGKMAGNPTKTNQVTHGFIVKNATFNNAQKFDVNEDIELLTVAPKKLLEMVADGEVWVADTVSFILKASLLHPEIFA